MLFVFKKNQRSMVLRGNRGWRILGEWWSTCYECNSLWISIPFGASDCGWSNASSDRLPCEGRCRGSRAWQAPVCCNCGFSLLISFDDEYILEHEFIFLGTRVFRWTLYFLNTNLTNGSVVNVSLQRFVLFGRFVFRTMSFAVSIQAIWMG